MFDGKIFQGITKSNIRRYAKTLIEKAKKNGVEKLYFPCCGQFTLAKVAVECGFKPSQLYCSDISSYTTLLGALFSNRKIEEFPFLFSEELAREIDGKEEIEKIATILYRMTIYKYMQFPHLNEKTEFLLDNKEAVVGQLIEKLAKAKEILDGVHYSVMDCRDVFENLREGEFSMFFPPLFKNGYEKMFDFGDMINLDFGCEQMSLEEFTSIFNKNVERGVKTVFFSDRELPLDDKYLCYIQEETIKKRNYIYCSDIDFADKKFTTQRPIKEARNAGLLPIKFNEKLSKSSRITVIPVNEERVAEYFRELFVKNLPPTGTSHSFAICIDGRVSAIGKVDTSNLSHLRSSTVFLNYFVVAPSVNKKFVRLMNNLVLTREFKRFIISTMQKNRTKSPKRLRTAILSNKGRVGSYSEWEKCEEKNGIVYYEQSFIYGDFEEVKNKYLKGELWTSKKG